MSWLLAAWRWLRALNPGSAAMPALLGLAVIGVGTGAVAVNRWFDARDAAARATAEAEAEISAQAARIAALEAEIAARASAAAVLRAHNDRLERVATERAALISELRSMEGADAPLPDYLRDVAQRLWRQPPPR